MKYFFEKRNTIKSSGIILMEFGRSPQKIVWKYLVTEKKEKWEQQ